MVLPAPDGPTSAVSVPAGTRKLTSLSTQCVPARSGSGSAIDSSEASDTSLAVGYRKQTPSNSMSGAVAAGAGQRRGSGQFGDQRLQVEHLEDPVEADQCRQHADLHVG